MSQYVAKYSRHEAWCKSTPINASNARGLLLLQMFSLLRLTPACQLSQRQPQRRYFLPNMNRLQSIDLSQAPIEHRPWSDVAAEYLDHDHIRPSYMCTLGGRSDMANGTLTIVACPAMARYFRLDGSKVWVRLSGSPSHKCNKQARQLHLK